MSVTEIPAALTRLVMHNAKGLLTSQTNGGFIDKLTNTRNQRKLCGVMRFLRVKTKAFPHMTKKQYRAKKSKKDRATSRRSGEKASNKRSGDAAHHHIYHTLFCGVRCECKLLFGKATQRSPNKSSSTYQLVRSALQFLSDQQLVPLCGEQIIVSVDRAVGTRFDCIAHKKGKPGSLVLISWKTGYTGIYPPEVVSGTLMMNKKAQSSDAISLSEHIAQLTCELFFLSNTHDVFVDEAYIVYLGATTSAYRATRLDAMWTRQEHIRGWNWLAEQVKL